MSLNINNLSDQLDQCPPHAGGGGRSARFWGQEIPGRAPAPDTFLCVKYA